MYGTAWYVNKPVQKLIFCILRVLWFFFCFCY